MVFEAQKGKKCILAPNPSKLAKFGQKWQFCRPPGAWLRPCVAPLGVPLGPTVVKESFFVKKKPFQNTQKKYVKKI